jgi:hypothetical protein
LFAALNVVFYVIDRASYEEPSPLQATYFQRDALETVYRDLGPAGVQRLIAETQLQEAVYEPFTQFREKPHPGEYVNIDPVGFRRSKGQGPWPPDPTQFNVFVFGGSTTFNYGLRDDDTIASYLWELLNAAGLPRTPRVYNFGRGAYYSSQELILFERLLASGTVPNVAIFIDGLNEFFFHDDRPALTEYFEGFVNDRYAHKSKLPELLQLLPVVKYVVRHWPAQRAGKMMGAPRRVKKTVDVSEPVIKRFVANKRLIEGVAASFGVVPLFVWQPVPTYHYAEPKAAKVNYGGHERSRLGYPKMAQFLHEHALEHFVWCADIHQLDLGPLYVDRVHYSPAMSAVLARCIFDGGRKQGDW